MAQSKYSYQEFSGALQQKSTTHIKKPNEVRSVKNADFATVIGAVRRRLGTQSSVATQPKLPYNTPTLGAKIARFPQTIEIWAAQDDDPDSPTQAKLSRWTGPGVGAWSDVRTGIPAGSEVNMVNDLEEVFVSTYNPVDDTIGESFTVDESHSVSTERQLAFAPDARFFHTFAGSMWAADVTVEGTRYRDRLYKSSGPTGAVTFVRSPQTDPEGDFTLTNQVPTMTSLTTPAGVAAASSTYSTYAAWYAFTGNLTTAGRWLANGTTGWLRYDFGSGNAKVITHYKLASTPSNQAGAADRSPKNFTIEGSNDASSWTVIQTKTNEPQFAAGEIRTYKTTNTTAYRYYRINVTANWGDPNYLCITSFQLLNSPDYTDTIELEVGSVRYLKPGMSFGIYEAGTDNLMYTIIPTEVDKINDTVTFAPKTQYFTTSNVNTTTDVITLSDASSFTTGKPIKFASSGTVPAGLSADTTYYAINVSSTTIKVATSLLNAQVGDAVDITSTGSGAMRVRISYIFGNKDEIWKTGRKNKLTRFWNTDYRNPEASDYIKLQATLDDNNQITGVGSTAARMFVFTETTMSKYDGQNFTRIRNDVGCISHRSIAYYDDYMLWLDSKANIWMRNEAAGQQDVISESIAEILKLVPDAQLPQASAVCVDDSYKLYLGQIDGVSLRVVYRFRTNQWTIEWHTPKMPVQLEYRYNNDVHPFFFDEFGQMWVDEEGTDDNGKAIPMELEIGNDTFGVDEIKKYYGLKIYSKAAVGSKVFARVDDGDWVEVGQIERPVESILINKLLKGTMINFKIVNSFKGDTPQIDKMTVWYDREEDTFRATR